MFVNNFNSLNSTKLICVNSDVKKYLENKGFCIVSKFDDMWYFTKTDELIKIISLYKGGEKNE